MSNLLRRLCTHPASDCFVLAGCVGFFLYWCLDGLFHQGIYTDVGLFGDLALGIYKQVQFEGPQFLHLGPYSIPLTVKSFHGAIPVYWILPWIYALGNQAVALHLAPLFFNVLCLPLLYLVARLLCKNRLSALLSAALMASAPSWVTATKLGLTTASTLAFWGLGALLCLLLWKSRGGFSWALLGFFSLGLGFGSQIYFLWFVAALAVCALLWQRRALRELCYSPWRGMMCLSVFSLGLLPIAVSNVIGGFHTLRFLTGNALRSMDGYSNLDYGKHLWLRLGHVQAVLEGSVWSFATEPNRFQTALALLCAGATLADFFLLRRRRLSLPIPRLFLIVFIGLVLIQSPLTPTGLQPHHLLAVLPLLYLWMADTVLNRPLESLWNRIILGSGCALLALSLYGNWKAFHVYRDHLLLHGGHEVRWNVMADVVSWLKSRNMRRIGLGDTGLMDPFHYLSGREILGEEVFWAPYLGVPAEERVAFLRRRLGAGEDGYYLFRSEGHEWVPFFNWFRRVAREEGKEVSEARTFYTGEGVPIFVLYRVRTGRLSDRP